VAPSHKWAFGLDPKAGDLDNRRVGIDINLAVAVVAASGGRMLTGICGMWINASQVAKLHQ